MASLHQHGINPQSSSERSLSSDKTRPSGLQIPATLSAVSRAFTAGLLGLGPAELQGARRETGEQWQEKEDIKGGRKSSQGGSDWPMMGGQQASRWWFEVGLREAKRRHSDPFLLLRPVQWRRFCSVRNAQSCTSGRIPTDALLWCNSV